MEIKLWADVDSPGLFDMEGNYFFPEELNIPALTCEEIDKWVRSYDPLITMSVEERHQNLPLISVLDSWGLFIAKRLNRELSNVTVKYYSEGLMRYLDLDS